MAGTHKHAGKTSRDILNARDVIAALPLKEGDVFLDAGCGDGFISVEASAVVGDYGKVLAVDIYPDSINSLKKEIAGETNIEAVLADITKKLPFGEGTVDIYFMANVFHGIVGNNETPDLMREVKRLLKPGGKLAIVEFKKIPGTPGPHIDFRLSEEETAKILAEYGFDVETVTEVGPYHYLIVASGPRPNRAA